MVVAAPTPPTPAPGMFDADRLQAARDSLLRKRARAAARAWPAVARALGEDFERRFVQYAAAEAPPAEGGPLADGRAFVQSLDDRKLPADARLEILAVDLRYRRGPCGLVLRRGPAVRVRRLAEPTRVIIAARLLGREAWFRLPWARERRAARRPAG